MHLHEFLEQIHLVVKPRRYLEVGVQHGTSLNLAHAAEVAIGVDPLPLTEAHGNQIIYTASSDDAFSVVKEIHPLLSTMNIDLGFIDGLHHFEQALRDFINIERHLNRDGVVVFDDVLPRNQAEAAREQCPGDWTGDVWKVTQILLNVRPELQIVEVDTAPTGTLLVYGFEKPSILTYEYDYYLDAVTHFQKSDVVPDNVISRAFAVDPGFALDNLREYLA